MKRLVLIASLTVVSFATDGIVQLGKNIYSKTCVSCHGADGKANTNIKLIVKPRNLSLTILNEEQTYKIIRDGSHFWGAKADIMPAFKYTYEDEQLRAVAYYIHNHFNKNLKAKHL